MCGQSGAAGSLYVGEKKAAENLMILNTIRGPHSTGLAVIPRIYNHNKHEEPTVIKELGTPYGDGDGGLGILGHKKYKDAMNKSAVCVMTHNRWATRGDISRKNCHPFFFEKDLVGTHNGTLEFSYKNKLIGADRFDTDSECLYNTIAIKGPKNTLEKIDGAYALAWYDLKKNTINLARNDDRPLYWCLNHDNQALFWSSTAYMLYSALEEAKVSRGENKVHLLTSNTIFSWKIPLINKAFDEPERIKITPPTFVQRVYSGGRRDDWDDPFYSGPDLQDVRSSKVSEEEDAKKKEEELKKKQEEEAKKASETNADEHDQHRINHAHYSCMNPNYKAQPSLWETRRQLAEAHKNSTPAPKVVEHNKAVAEEQFKLGPAKNIPTNWIKKHDASFDKVWWDPDTRTYVLYQYITVQAKWFRSQSESPPNCLPFKMINIEAGGSHLFSYQKKRKQGGGKETLVFYKGFKGNLLSEAAFSTLMAKGCINCDRSPVWGNEVRFINKEIFLCEHSKDSPNIVNLVMKS